MFRRSCYGRCLARNAVNLKSRWRQVHPRGGHEEAGGPDRVEPPEEKEVCRRAAVLVEKEQDIQ